MTNALRLGIAGLGTVGTGVLDILSSHADLLSRRAGRPVQVTAVSARIRAKSRGQHDLSQFEWHSDPVALAKANNVDVLIELMGGADGPAKDAVEAALASGKHVITANKALLAKHGAKLARLAESNQAALYFEAAVAGGIPVIKTLREALAGNQIRKLFGILNGTCNYILTKMQTEGRSFSDVLKEAQELGYAEADPTFDVGGFDTAHKLAILTSLAFGTEVNADAISIEGIEAITLADIRNADELGYKIKLLGVAAVLDGGIEQRVHPTLIPKESPVAETNDVFNAVVLKGDFVGDLLLEGRGAGGHPTASAVIGDVIDLARGHRVPAFGISAKHLKPYNSAPVQAHEGGFYIALELHDRPGAVAAITQILAAENISIESIIQRGSPAARKTASFILLTHNSLELAVSKAMARIQNDGHVEGVPRVIRIEKL